MERSIFSCLVHAWQVSAADAFVDDTVDLYVYLAVDDYGENYFCSVGDASDLAADDDLDDPSFCAFVLLLLPRDEDDPHDPALVLVLAVRTTMTAMVKEI